MQETAASGFCVVVGYLVVLLVELGFNGVPFPVELLKMRLD